MPPKTIRRNGRTYYVKKKKTYKKKKSVQNKFKLPKARPSVVRSIAPIVETKKFTGRAAGAIFPIQTFYMSTTGPTSIIVPPSWAWMVSRGDEPTIYNAIDGREIFSKYLQAKLMISYPNGAGAPQDPPRPLEVVYGFCHPLLRTDQNGMDTLTRNDYLQHVVDALGDDFDSADDNMEFKDKKRRLYNISGRFKVTPNLMKQVVQNPVNAHFGAHPMRRNINWKTMKKTRYHRSADSVGANPTNDPFLYPNEAYIPFFLLYNRDYANYSANVGGEAPVIKQIQIKWNSCHWFNDN